MEEKDVIISVDHLTKDYGYGRGVFDVCMEVHRGECYGYLGPNGAGKSTTIRHLMGFSKPTTGSTKIFGIETFGNTAKILKDVGYLPGEPAIPAGLNGLGFLRMMQDMRGERNEERLNYLLDLFKLEPAVPVPSMSLGEKRKLAVVAAFMNDPEVLVLDEPTSGLDPVMQEVFIKFIVEEKKRGKTILLSSHIFSEVDATCDTISIIKDGRNVSTFVAADLKNAEIVTYIVRFADAAEAQRFAAVKDESFAVDAVNEKRRLVTVKVQRKLFKQFFGILATYRIREMEEKPFTLQDYFMSFYKEEKTFGGLGGVEGNRK